MGTKYKISDFITLTPKQKEVYKYVGKGYRIFAGGARGGGKTEVCRASAILSALQFPGIKICCVRETYSELEINFILPMLQKYKAEIFGYKYRERSKMMMFNNGSIIYFRSCANEKDAQKIQGIEFQLMIIDEACNMDEYVIHKLTGSLRNATITNFKATLLMTGNPGGISDDYFISRFIEKNYEYWTEGEKLLKDYYVYIPMFVSDNPYMSEEYKDWLYSLPNDLREAWLFGNWKAFYGSFFSEFNYDVHVIQPFTIPDNWVRKGGFDIGWKSHPACALWVAQDPDTENLYVYREYVECGVTEDYIRNIISLTGSENVIAWYLDPSMFYLKEKNTRLDESSAMLFQRAGLPVIPANNNRVEGWRVLKQWLHHTPTRKPKLFIFSNCTKLIACLQTLKYNSRARTKKEDADTNQFDDPADALRYVVVSGFLFPETEITYDITITSDNKNNKISINEIMDRFISCDYDSIEYNGDVNYA